MRIRLVLSVPLGILLSVASAMAGAGGASGSSLSSAASSDSATSPSRIEKINRHALKSAVAVRQLLAKNGVSAAQPAK